MASYSRAALNSAGAFRLEQIRLKRRERVVKTALAKLTCPVMTGEFRRTRLFRLLDKTRKSPIVWINGPAGAGKTTLAASYLKARRLPTLWYRIDAGDSDLASFIYHLGVAANAIGSRRKKALPLLTPEYRAGLSIFVASYFRELFAGLKRPSVIVLDNYQEVGVDAELHELLQQAAEQIPTGVQIIVLSREQPSRSFARVRASARLAIIGSQELKLTEQESAGIVKLRQKRVRFTREEIYQLHQDTQGWVAGLVLLTERVADSSVGRSLAPPGGNQCVFEYFASEIFRYGDPAIRSFLLKTAFLPTVSATIAQALTGEPNSKPILENLTRRNLFTVMHSDGSYEYHPLFRSFLVNVANTTYSPEEIAALKSHSAQLLIASGDVETGIALLLQAQDWLSALRLILTQARAVFVQGRTHTLEAWLNHFPESLRADHPWVLYWQGLCRLVVAPVEARGYFEQAFALFEKQNDASPLYLAWSGIVETFVLEMNDFVPLSRWIDCYGSLAVGRLAPAPEIETASVFTYVTALLFGRTDHPDLPAYVERAELLFQNETDADRRFNQAASLLSYHLWVGNVASVGRLLDILGPYARASDAKPLARLNWYTYEAVYATGTGMPEESLRVLSEGFAFAESTGVRLYDIRFVGFSIYAQLCIGNVAAAHALMKKMWALAGRGHFSDAVCSHFACMVFSRKGDNARAIEEGRRSVALFRRAGSLFGVAQSLIALACASAQQGDTASALADIDEARVIAQRIHSKSAICLCAFGEANIRRLQGEQAHSLRALAETLTLLSQIGTVTPVWCSREDAATLYAAALDADIHSDYVRKIVTKARLQPPPGYISEQWPWSIRIRALGRLHIDRDGAPLVFSGKTQKKPLELISAVAAFGGRGVSITKLVQTLWPDADGDVARATLRVTLLRVRKLIGEDAIVQQEGQFSFNEACCWLDVWAFERLCAAAAETRFPAAIAQQLLTLYRGVLLADDEAPWVLTQRDRLRSKFLRTITQLGYALQKQDQAALAIDLYQKGIEVDPLAEDFYRHLMRHYVSLERPTEALALYQRCRATLARELHIEPTVETKAIYRGITSQTA